MLVRFRCSRCGCRLSRQWPVGHHLIALYCRCEHVAVVWASDIPRVFSWWLAWFASR